MADSYTQPNLDKSALVIIDTQNDFTLPNAIAEIEGTSQVVPKIQKSARLFRQFQLPIIHIVRMYKSDASNVDICRKKTIESGIEIVMPNSGGSQIVKEVLPKATVRLNPEILFDNKFQQIGRKEWIMYKSRWGAFYNTKLEQHLRTLGVDTVVICGCNFPNCPRTTIYQASERDFRLVLLKDATSQIYEKGLQELRKIGVETIENEELGKKLNSLKN